MFIGPTRKTILAPKERHGYPAVHYPYIALRWSAISSAPAGYKHVAPPEHKQVSQVCHCR